jgi:hypothetical protein
MREQLAGEFVWLVGGLLYAWLMCALARLAAFAPARVRRVPVSVPVKPRCAPSRSSASAREYGVAADICFALLSTVPPGVLAAGIAHTAGSVVMVVAGACAGMWTGIRFKVGVRVRVTAVAGCVGGLAALGGGFAWFLACAEPALPEQRAALYLAVALGALLTGAAACALYGEVRTRVRPPSAARGGMVYVVALGLGIALGYGFATAFAGNEFGLAALVGASVLGAAFGARLMTDAMTGAITGAPMSGTRPPRVARFALAPHAGSASSAGVGLLRPGFAGVPDELLVEACGSGFFAPDYLYARAAPSEGAASAVHHVSRDVLRRRRSRHRAQRYGRGVRARSPGDSHKKD